MKFWDIIKAANSNMLRNKGRSFLTILAVFIGAFTIIMTTGINAGVNGYIDRQLESAGGKGYIEIMPSSTADQFSSMMGGSGGVTEYNPEEQTGQIRSITEKDIEQIRAVPGIQTARAFVEVQAAYITAATTDKKFVINVNEMPTDRINVDMATGRSVDVGSDRPEIVLLSDYAEALGFESDEAAVGQTVRIGAKNLVSGQISEVAATVSGVQNRSVVNMNRSWINEALLSKLDDVARAGLPIEYRNQAMFAFAEFDPNLNDKEIAELKNRLEEIGFVGMTIEDQVGMIKTFFDAVTMVLTIFGLIALMAASIGIINTLFMAVQERTREIGLMKAMGLGRGKIRTMFSFEAVALGFWGSVLAIAAGCGAAALANHLAGSTFLKDLPGFTLVVFRPVSLLVIAFIVMFIAFLAGTLPARRAAKLDPIDALRYE